MRSSAPSSQHRSKRAFQPDITSYFAYRDDSDSDDDSDECSRGHHPSPRPQQRAKYSATQNHHHHHHHHHPPHRRDSLAPVLPGPVQANLLSVGMRVRKSVPEGYQTHTPKTKLGALPSIQTALGVPTLAVKPPSDAVPDDFVHQRELLPFCGLHKIGGLGFAEQPTTNLHLYAGRDASGSRVANAFPLPAEAFTTPFAGAQRAAETSQRPLNPSKRSWVDDDAAASAAFFFALPVKGPAARVEEVPVSPLSESPPQAFGGLPAARLFAQPKSRRARTRSGEGDEMMDVDGEFDGETQVEGRVAAGSGSDFEEADFLGREVDMSGL